MKKLLTIFILLFLVLTFGRPALANLKCNYVLGYLENLRSYSFMGRVDTRVLKNRLGGQYTEFESKCQNESKLNGISYDENDGSCGENFVQGCTSNEDFRNTIYYATLHQKANKELLEKHKEKVNKPCTADDNTLEETIKAAMGAEEPVKKEYDILVDRYMEGQWRWYGYWYFDVHVWQTFSARSTWANEHICTVGVDEFDQQGHKRVAYRFKKNELMFEKYDNTGKVTEPAIVAIEDINKKKTNALDDNEWWCNTNGTSKCIIRKQIKMSGNISSGAIDDLMKEYQPQDYLKGLIWPFEIEIVSELNVNGCSKEHRIYPADDRTHPLIVRECVKDASPKSPKYLDITDYHSAVEDAGQWHVRLEPLLRAQSLSSKVIPPLKTEKEGYYVCYGDGEKCLVQGHYGNLEAVVKVHIKDKKWQIERIPAIKDGKGTKADITAEDGVFYYGISAEQGGENSVVRIIPSDKPESTISCNVNGKEVTRAGYIYSLDPSEHEQITIAADASNVEITCSITLTGSLQFSGGSKMNLWLDTYEEDTGKYECSKNNPGYHSGKDGCSDDVDMDCLWCSENNGTLEAEGKPVDTGNPQELKVSTKISKKDIPWGKTMGLLSWQNLEINGGLSASAAADNGAWYGFGFGANVAFVEEGHFICEDGITYGETCPCDGDDIWDTTSGTCVQDCGTEAKWSIASDKCECLTAGLEHNSYSDKCYDPTICDNIKGGAEYNEEADKCLCSVSHMTLKGNECACDASNNRVSDGSGGCMCAAGYTVKGDICASDGGSSACSADSDCGDGKLCKDGTCTGGDEPEPLGGGCKSNSDCSTGMICSLTTEECECDLANNWNYESSTDKCEYKEPAIDAMCAINGGTYISKEAYCEYNKSIADCKVAGGTWEDNQCSDGDDPPNPKSGGCSLVSEAAPAGSMGMAIAYLSMLGSILFVRARKIKRTRNILCKRVEPC